jgi:catechol 2,3-dioxygenase-like lactoylglutathione lyase family enzyme
VTVAVGSLNHVSVTVRDLDASLRFYVDGLGLRKTLDKPIGENTWRLLRLPAPATGRTVFLQGRVRVGQIELVKWDLPVPPDSEPKRPGDPGFAVLSFPVDADAIWPVYDRLRKLGAECYSEPTATTLQDYGKITLFVCEDPDGNQIEIVNLPSVDEVRAFRARTRRLARGA